MTIAEIAIRHILWGIPDARHVTPDGQKIYFLLGTELHKIQCPPGATFTRLTKADIEKLVEDYILSFMEDHLNNL